MIRPQMGTHNKSEMVAVHGTYAIPSRNSNSGDGYQRLEEHTAFIFSSESSMFLGKVEPT
jgi:hypothetical protein